MGSVWQNNKLLKKWEQKNFKKIANGDFNYNLLYPLNDPLVIAISNFLNVKKKYIYVGAGSSQLIVALVGLKCWERVFLSDIEFALYKRTAHISEKKVQYIKGITIPEFLKNLKKQKSTSNDLLCFSSPRWSSGEMFSKTQVQEITNVFKGTIVIDEAYIDYSNDENGMLELCLDNDRIIILRSFSKKFLASGYRAGYAITKKYIEGMRNTIIPPHSVSSYSESFFVNLLNEKKILKAFEDTRNYIKKNRDLIYEELKNSKKMKVLKSNANFISLFFYDFQTMENVYDSLKDLAGVQKFDEIVPFIKIWVNNEKFSNIVINRVKKLVE